LSLAQKKLENKNILQIKHLFKILIYLKKLPKVYKEVSLLSRKNKILK